MLVLLSVINIVAVKIQINVSKPVASGSLYLTFTVALYPIWSERTCVSTTHIFTGNKF